MKVLLVSSGSGSRGGGEIYLQLLAEGLSALGHDVFALVGSELALTELADSLGRSATVHRLKMRNTFGRRTRMVGAILDLGQQDRVERFVRELAPDVVHVNQQVAEDGLDLLLAARRSGLPYLSTIHIARSAQSLSAKLGPLRDRVTTAVLGRLNATHIVVAEHARRNLIERLGQGSVDRIAVVRNGVCRAAANHSELHSNVGEDWRTAADEIVIGCVGRLEEQKNPLFAIKVCAELRRRGRPVRLVWIGDGPLRAQLLSCAREYGIERFVTIEGWRSDVERCLSGFDIFILCSRFEGLSLALLEAMCAGLPTCVSDTAGMSEAVQEGVNGFICRAGEMGDWAARLECLINNRDLRVRLGSAAQTIARSKFSVDQMCRDTVAIYNHVLEKHSDRNNGGDL